MNRFGSRITALAGAIAMMISFAPSLSVSAYQIGDNTYEWKVENGKRFWYENGVRQGVYGSKGNVFYDDSERGREIYDSESDGWYWLDAVYDGAKAVNKEVFMPYIYSDEEKMMNDDEWVNTVAALSNKTESDVFFKGGELVDLSAQIKRAIECHGGENAGKWVRYDADGKMIKGWYKVQGDDEILYPEQKGNVYYYDRQTGLMAKGTVTIDKVTYVFDEISGRLLSGNEPDIFEKDDKFISEDDTITVNGITRLNNGNYHVSSAAKNITSDTKAGDVVKFGKYEQDANFSNGREDIEWEVLDVIDGKAFLVSRYVLDHKRFDETGECDNWYACTLRKWLNDYFYDTAFDDKEKEKIAVTWTSNPFDPEDQSMINPSDDKLFCLGFTDIRKYYGFSKQIDDGSLYGINYHHEYSMQLMVDGTPYAKSIEYFDKKQSELMGGAEVNSMLFCICLSDFMHGDEDSIYELYGYSPSARDMYSASWWIRSMSSERCYALHIMGGGEAGTSCGLPVDSLGVGIRPAMWVNL